MYEGNVSYSCVVQEEGMSVVWTLDGTQISSTGLKNYFETQGFHIDVTGANSSNIYISYEARMNYNGTKIECQAVEGTTTHPATESFYVFTYSESSVIERLFIHITL